MADVIQNADGTYTVQLGRVIGENIVINRPDGNPCVIKYPKGSFDKAVDKLNDQEIVFGEINQPTLSDCPTVVEKFGKWGLVNLANVSHTIKDIRVVEDLDGKERVYGSVKPGGQYGGMLKEMLEDPKSDIEFGLRAYIRSERESESGNEVHYVGDIITWDVIIPNKEK